MTIKSNDNNLWDNKEEAENILKQKSFLENIYNKYNNFCNNVSYYEELNEIADEELDKTINNDIKKIVFWK